jgi:hypothetical protein
MLPQGATTAFWASERSDLAARYGWLAFYALPMMLNQTAAALRGSFPIRLKTSATSLPRHRFDSGPYSPFGPWMPIGYGRHSFAPGGLLFVPQSAVERRDLASVLSELATADSPHLSQRRLTHPTVPGGSCHRLG